MREPRGPCGCSQRSPPFSLEARAARSRAGAGAGGGCAAIARPGRAPPSGPAPGALQPDGKALKPQRLPRGEQRRAAPVTAQTPRLLRGSLLCVGQTLTGGLRAAPQQHLQNRACPRCCW